MSSLERALVVEVGAPVPPVLRETLEDMGHEVTVASGLDETPGPGGASWPDLAVVVCGAGDGSVELVRELRARDERTTILALVEPDASDRASRLVEAGADDVLPTSPSEAEIRARLGVHRRVRAALEGVREKEDHGRVVLELTRTLASSLDFEDILFEVVRRIAEVIEVGRCSIVLTGGDARKGYVVASSEDRGVRDLPIELTKYPEVQKVLAEGGPLVIDVGSDPLLDAVRSQIPPGGPATSALFAITHEDRPMGVLFLRFMVRRDELTERELDFCQTVANATAIALRNARIVSALKDEQARITHAHTEAERKVQALSAYADFFESSADGMLVVDTTGGVLYANPRIATLTGASIDELADRTLEDLVVEDERSLVGRLLAEFARGTYPRGLDLGFRGAGGDPVVLSVSASSTLKLANGILLILRDVTAARAIESELRRTKEFLEGLIAQSVDAVIAADMTGRLLLFNPAAERVLGYEASEVLGKGSIASMYPAGLAREIMRKLRSDEFGGPGRLEQTRASIVAQDGTEVPISMTGGMIFEDGEPRATFGIFTDLRPILEIENDLARTRLELMERERQAIAAQLAGAAAHELNQPLTFVMASVELLRRKLGATGAYDRVIDTILSETERMAQIVRKIGRITHYETKTYVGSTRILDLDRAASGGGPAAEVIDLNPVPPGEQEDTAVGRPTVEQAEAIAKAAVLDGEKMADARATEERAEATDEEADLAREEADELTSPSIVLDPDTGDLVVEGEDLPAEDTSPSVRIHHLRRPGVVSEPAAAGGVGATLETERGDRSDPEGEDEGRVQGRGGEGGFVGDEGKGK